MSSKNSPNINILKTITTKNATLKEQTGIYSIWQNFQILIWDSVFCSENQLILWLAMLNMLIHITHVGGIFIVQLLLLEGPFLICASLKPESLLMLLSSRNRGIVLRVHYLNSECRVLSNNVLPFHGRRLKIKYIVFGRFVKVSPCPLNYKLLRF